MRFLGLVTAGFVVLCAGCGSPTPAIIESTVATQAASRIGAAPTDVRCVAAKPPPLIVGKLELNTATHTCTLAFPDRPSEVWAVQVLDFITAGTVQLQYRVDHNPNVGRLPPDGPRLT